MLSSLQGSTLGVWVSHGEGKFNYQWVKTYNIVAKYGYEGYPANPNGSDFNTAMLCDTTGRHLLMPHIERSTFQWNWHIIQRIETMFRLGMKPCECQKWIDKNKFSYLYIESVLERALFFWSLFKLFWA
jgi:phosphoribosylformylglycinamidine synthase